MPRDLDAFPIVETTPVYSLRGLIAWLETQPPETTYGYMDNDSCLLARYFAANGFANPRAYTGCVVEGTEWPGRNPGAARLFPGSASWDCGNNAFNRIASGSPRSIGAALTRARAALNGSVRP